MSITEKAPQNTKPQTIEQTPRDSRPKRRIVPLRYKMGAVGVAAASIAAVAAVKKLDIPTPSIHEELHALPPEIPDGVLVTKLGALGAYSMSKQTYQAKTYVRLVNEDNEERETLGYQGDYRVTRAQVGTPTVTHGQQGQKRISLPTTLDQSIDPSVTQVHDDNTGRDGGQAVIGYIAASATNPEHGFAMAEQFIGDIARNDDIAKRQTLCVGVAATSQLLSSLQMDGYFVPTYTLPGQSKMEQPDNTRLITVEADYNHRILNVETCAPELADIGYDPAIAGNMLAGAAMSVKEMSAGMALPERKIDQKTIDMAYADYTKANG